MDAAQLLAAARELADLADAESLPRFRRPLVSTLKDDGTWVTEADRAVEAALRARIAAAHPDHAVLGEEEGGAIDPSVPTWVIDPIDATNNYRRGIPIWATLIGVVVDGRAVVGVASAPALGERWEAAEGLGATRNGERIAVSDVDRLEDAQVLHGGLDWYRKVPGLWDVLAELSDRSARMRGFGDFWNHLLVAGGMAEIAFEDDLRPWDVAALECIVTEAGGRMTSFTGGSPLHSRDVLTTNGRLHEQMKELLHR